MDKSFEKASSPPAVSPIEPNGKTQERTQSLTERVIEFVDKQLRAAREGEEWRRRKAG